jgi:predicted MPP superfamily phosphohydrolase
MAYQLRQVSLPLLPSGARDIRILHFSDLHLTPARKREIADIKGWARLRPDLVISTGDFLAHREAVGVALNALNELLDLPGLYVFGSNDYYAPKFKNPLSYLKEDSGERKLGEKLPIEEFDRQLQNRGWINLNNKRSSITINGLTIDTRGTDDAHLELDEYERVAGKKSRELSIGVTHAPYSRVLNAMAKDGIDVIFAGHTHGGQIRVPWFGGTRSLTTNCDLPNWRSRGLTKSGLDPYLHISAGMGYNPFTPIRFLCPSEASIVTLTSQFDYT